MTFIEKQQELAMQELFVKSESINESLWYVNPADVQELITQIIHNTGAELLRRIKIEIEDK